MTIHQPGNAAEIRLPKVFIDRLTRPFGRFLAIEAASGAVLLSFTIAALVLSNSPWAHSFLDAWEMQIGFQVGAWEFSRALRDWINDGLMTLFFFLVSLELKRELVLGELRSPRVAALSISAAPQPAHPVPGTDLSQPVPGTDLLTIARQPVPGAGGGNRCRALTY